MSYGPLLSWRPPGWNGGDPTLASSFPGYTVINLANDGSNRIQVLNDNTDYYCNIDNYVGGPGGGFFGFAFDGGRNLVIVGGSVTMTTDPGAFNGVLTLRQQTGVVHIEGLEFTGAYCNDCIRILNTLNAKPATTSSAVIQIQNCRAHSQAYNLTTAHNDAFQTQFPFYGTLRFDKVTYDTSYQGMPGLFGEPGIPEPEEGYIGQQVLMRRVNARVFNDGVQTLQNYFYQERRTNSPSGVYFDLCYGEKFGATQIENLNYPNATQGRNVFGAGGYPEGGYLDKCTRGTDAIGSYCEWLPASNLFGRIYEGVPPGGDYVAAGVAGTNYVSPGYTNPTSRHSRRRVRPLTRPPE